MRYHTRHKRPPDPLLKSILFFVATKPFNSPITQPTSTDHIALENMPHKQKENHDHSAKGKKERLRQKQDAEARKQAKLAAAKALEEEKKLLAGNDIPLVEGHGAYEIGCEPEKEYNFNIRKRSKKHLRNDLRLKAEREEKEQEEEERRRAEAAAREASPEEEQDEDEEDEEEVIVEEYMVYICECCDKRYATKNHFLNHSNSKKHKDLVRIYEELGLIVTHIELRGENGNDKEAYDDYEEDAEIWNDANAFMQQEHKKEESDENDQDSDEEDVQPRENLFAAFADDSSSSSSVSSEESDVEDDKQPPKPAMPIVVNDSRNDLKEDEINFDELIHQNKLIQKQIDTENNANATIALIPERLPFDRNYDPNDYGVNENRLVAVQHRLQKRLAERGIVSSHGTGPSDAVAIGRTLLQEVLDANIETLQTKLEAYNRHKKDCQLLGREFARMRGNSKALSAQFVFKQDAADNARSRANVHHAGSHYHMQMARSMQFGRSKGLMARHSSQGARLQASRMAAKETSRMQSGGGRMKVGKTSKKSNMKRQGQAGGSKKTGGKKGEGE